MKRAGHGKGGDTVASKCKQVVFLKTLALAPYELSLERYMGFS